MWCAFVCIQWNPAMLILFSSWFYHIRLHAMNTLFRLHLANMALQMQRVPAIFYFSFKISTVHSHTHTNSHSHMLDSHMSHTTTHSNVIFNWNQFESSAINIQGGNFEQRNSNEEFMCMRSIAMVVVLFGCFERMEGTFFCCRSAMISEEHTWSCMS